MDGSGSKQSGPSHPQLSPTLAPVLARLSYYPWSHPPPDRLMTTFRGVWLQDVYRAAVLLVQAGLAMGSRSSGENTVSHLQAFPIPVHPLPPAGWPPGLPHRLSRLPLLIEFNFTKDEKAKICGIILRTY